MADLTPQSRSFSFYPMFWIALAFAGGIVFANAVDGYIWMYLLITVLLAAMSTFLIRKPIAWYLIITSFFALGAFCIAVEKSSVPANQLKNLYDSGRIVSGDPLEIEGVLKGKPELSIGGIYLTLRAEKIVYHGEEKSVTGSVKLFAPIHEERLADEYQQLGLEYGTRLRTACRPIREDEYQNPGVIRQPEMLDRQGLDARCVIKSPLLIENLGRESVFLPLAWVYERRKELIIDFRQNFSNSTTGVLIASLLGNKDHLDKTTAESFREGGTFHVLVISGFHITMIGGLIFLLVRRYTRNRLWQVVVTNSALWLFAQAVGAEPPVLRAALMFTILSLGYAIFRQGTMLNSLGAAALVLLVWRPSDVFDPSFQLTFTCVFAIVGVAFPLLDRLRVIGEWHPSIGSPIPPNVSQGLKTFCEMLYWSERKWQLDLRRTVWECRLFKTQYAERFERWHLQTPVRYIFEALLVSTTVQVWLIPFLVVYFHRIAFGSIVLNVWVSVLMTVETVLGVLSVFLSRVSMILAKPFIYLTESINSFILWSTSLVSGFDWASFRLPPYTGPGRVIYFLYFVPICVLGYVIYRWNPFEIGNGPVSRRFYLRTAVAGSIFVLLINLGLIIFHPGSESTSDGRMHVEFLDVGQGDSILLTMPTGERILVDGGGRPDYNSVYVLREGEEPEYFEPDNFEVGEAVVSQFLWSKGYDRIDYLVASHSDADHIQGLANIAANFEVKKAFYGVPLIESKDFLLFMGTLEKKNIPSEKILASNRLDFGAVKIEILNPTDPALTGARASNNNSVVMRIEYGERVFLLTGDIESETEAQLLNGNKLKADVVKVPHHGSRTSSSTEFLGAVGPMFAVISVGKRSPFGQPYPGVIERLKQLNAQVLTTGENGTISFSTDGRDLEITTFKGAQIYR